MSGVSSFGVTDRTMASRTYLPRHRVMNEILKLDINYVSDVRTTGGKCVRKNEVMKLACLISPDALWIAPRFILEHYPAR